MKRQGGTKNRIERAALELFVQKGVKGASVRKIARAAGITEGALYRHFVSKEQLAEGLFTRPYAEMTAELKGIARGPGSFAARLAAMVDVFCRAFDDDPALTSYLLLSQHEELRKLGPDAPSPHAVLKNAVAGAVRGMDPALGASLVMGLVLETAKSLIYGRIAKKRMQDLAPDLKKASYRVFNLPEAP